MHKAFYVLLFYLLLTFGCSSVSKEPIQTFGNVEFGHYTFLSPNGYWYFPRKFPKKFKTSEDFFLITFWKDKDILPLKSGQIPNDVFFNFGVFKNEYKNFDSYYTAMESHGIENVSLPEEIKYLMDFPKWDCKYFIRGSSTIECISLMDNLIIMGAYGPTKDKLFFKAPVLKEMLSSFIASN